MSDKNNALYFLLLNPSLRTFVLRKEGMKIQGASGRAICFTFEYFIPREELLRLTADAAVTLAAYLNESTR